MRKVRHHERENGAEDEAPDMGPEACCAAPELGVSASRSWIPNHNGKITQAGA